MGTAGDALRRLGLLPDEADAECVTGVCGDGDDLLPRLAAAWSSSVSGACGAGRLRRERIAQRLQQWHARGAALSWGVPGQAGLRLSDWIGVRIAWWPAGLPDGRPIGLVSSRLGRDLAARRTWFTALRGACMHLDPGSDLLVTARSIATQRLAYRAGQLFGLRVLDVTIGPEQAGERPGWVDRLLRAGPGRSERAWQLVLLPPCEADEGSIASLSSELPPADRAVFGLSERLVVLTARPQGNVQRLIERRLSAADFPPASVYLAVGPGLVPPELAEPWMDRGAVGWYLTELPGETRRPAAAPPWWAVERARRGAAPIRRVRAIEGRCWLTHWTRRRWGPWPGQQETDYLDDLILDRAGADHSAFAALWRIVQTRRVLATSDLIRGGTPMVCLTEVPLSDLPQLRSFRAHLARWDFELYGVSIDRDWLQARGARPVLYGDQQLWETLEADDRPYFQKEFSQLAGGGQLDWSGECEWRHRGDLLLDEVPVDAAIVFVPEVSHARQIAGISPWPIVVLDGRR